MLLNQRNTRENREIYRGILEELIENLENPIKIRVANWLLEDLAPRIQRLDLDSDDDDSDDGSEWSD